MCKTHNTHERKGEKKMRKNKEMRLEDVIRAQLRAMICSDHSGKMGGDVVTLYQRFT